MADNLPYVTSIGTLENMLNKMKSASIPERFTHDFVQTILGMKGGTAAAVVPFIKKMGFVASDGTPTDLYREYKNPNKSGIAIAKAFKKLYSKLYEKNEYIESTTEKDLKGYVIECTGAEDGSATIKYTIATIKLLKQLADFSNRSENVEIDEPERGQPIAETKNAAYNHLPQIQLPQTKSQGINLSYTINLNLPATKDIEVFNAIFKSLKSHLLEE